MMVAHSQDSIGSSLCPAALAWGPRLKRSALIFLTVKQMIEALLTV